MFRRLLAESGITWKRLASMVNPEDFVQTAAEERSRGENADKAQSQNRIS
jgi:hypothetical protein